MRSLSDAMSGFDINAGSIPRRRKINGNTRPLILPKTTTRNTVSASTLASDQDRNIKLPKKASSISVVPRIVAVSISRFISRNKSDLSKSSTAIARMISVADCVPAFPPLARTSGRNEIIQTNDVETDW